MVKSNDAYSFTIYDDNDFYYGFDKMFVEKFERLFNHEKPDYKDETPESIFESGYNTNADDISNKDIEEEEEFPETKVFEVPTKELEKTEILFENKEFLLEDVIEKEEEEEEEKIEEKIEEDDDEEEDKKDNDDEESEDEKIDESEEVKEKEEEKEEIKILPDDIPPPPINETKPNQMRLNQIKPTRPLFFKQAKQTKTISSS